LDDEDDDNTDDEEEKLKESIDAKITDVSSTNQTPATTNPAAKPAGNENKIPGQGIEADKIKAVQEIAALVNAKIDASVKAKKSMEGGTPEIKTEASAVKPAAESNANENSSLYAFEIEINDYPQKARWRVTNKVNYPKKRKKKERKNIYILLQ